jgi:hypothetical protein
MREAAMVTARSVNHSPAPTAPATHAQLLGDQLRLATEIADEASRSEVQCLCNWLTELDAPEPAARWYDLEGTSMPRLDRAMQYLLLRGIIVAHPVRPRLVRFVR